MAHNILTHIDNQNAYSLPHHFRHYHELFVFRVRDYYGVVGRVQRLQDFFFVLQGAVRDVFLHRVAAASVGVGYGTVLHQHQLVLAGAGIYYYFSSVYFVCRPLALLTGYFLAFFFSFWVRAARTSILRSWPRRSR